MCTQKAASRGADLLDSSISFRKFQAINFPCKPDFEAS
jgi:hypothetical protein